MKKQLKNKIIFGATAMLITIMLISIAVVSILVGQQNLRASNDLIKKSFVIINDAISERQELLLSAARRMTQINDMGTRIKFVFGTKTRTDSNFMMMKTTYEEIANDIYNIGLSGNIYKSAVYDSNKNLVAITIIDDNQNYLGYVHNPATIMVASLKPDEKLTLESWKKQNLPPGIELKYTKDLLKKETISFERINNFLCLVSYVPIMGEVYNRKTEKMEEKQFGFVTASLRLGNKFIKKTSLFSGTRINIFFKDSLSVGSLKEYKTYNAGFFNMVKKTSKINKEKILLNTLSLNNKSYFQGVSPIYSDSKCLAAIVSLYSKDIAKANTWQMIKLLGLVSLIGIVLILPFAIYFSNSLTKPISKVVAGLHDVAQGEGDLTMRLKIKAKDEVGELAKWFNTFVSKLQKMIQDIAKTAEVIDSSSSSLSGISDQMSEGTDQMSSMSNAVAAAAEEMSTNMNSVAAAMEQASTNIEMVATASEEMSATINEVAKNSGKASSMTGEAVSQVRNASDGVNELGMAAQKIGKVTETITAISKQTNLLALNATIEAARAGESGKGFAVVANEIKELARQTADATLEIKENIDGIQGSTGETITRIEQILKVINDVNDIVSTIAASVEEQSVTTKEISNNVAQASQGIGEVNENIAQTSIVGQEIARDIAKVSHATIEMSDNNKLVNQNAGNLSNLAQKLKNMVGRFTV